MNKETKFQDEILGKMDNYFGELLKTFQNPAPFPLLIKPSKQEYIIVASTNLQKLADDVTEHLNDGSQIHFLSDLIVTPKGFYQVLHKIIYPEVELYKFRQKRLRQTQIPSKARKFIKRNLTK